MLLTGHRLMVGDDPVVHREFERHVDRAPDRPAVSDGTRSFTYAELDERANRLAHVLLARGVDRTGLVGLCLDRTPELVVAILAVLKTGAAYVPLDPTYPAERLERMVGRVPGMRWVFVSDDTRALVRADGPELLDLAGLAAELAAAPATRPQVEVTGADLCYGIFTSGSTGAPKATAVRHAGWYNLLNWLVLEFGLTPDSSNLMISSFGFDISQRSLLTPLFSGATLHLLPSRRFDVLLAGRMIDEFGVRTLHCAPSALYMLLDRDLATGGGGLRPLEHVFVGGEPLSGRRVAAWAAGPGARTRLVNVYGVAECTDVSTFHVLTPGDPYPDGVPIGRPVHNVDIHLLDDELRPAGPAETGEIHIAGIGVGVGYFDPAPVDESRFVTVGGIRLYRTGDLGFLPDDGELRCVGRVDDQVKVRGMRIDLGDVEAALRGQPSVRDAVVLGVRPQPGAEPELVAFVLPADGATPGEDAERVLRAAVQAAVPDWMVPRRILFRSEFPLSPNGKTDREALAAAARPAAAPPTPAVALVAAAPPPAQIVRTSPLEEEKVP